MQPAYDSERVSCHPHVRSPSPVTQVESLNYQSFRLSLSRWLRKLYWNNDAFKSSTNFQHIRVHYYWSQTKVSSFLEHGVISLIPAQVNPTRVVAVGPTPDIEPL